VTSKQIILKADS